MDTLYTFGDHVTHYKTKSAHILGLMNSATKRKVLDIEATSHHCIQLGGARIFK